MEGRGVFCQSLLACLGGSRLRGSQSVGDCVQQQGGKLSAGHAFANLSVGNRGALTGEGGGGEVDEVGVP